MTGTLGGALRARGIQPAGNLVTEVVGEVEKVDSIFVLARVRLTYRFKVPPEKREEAERALQVHHQGCPVYQSLQRGIQVEWTAQIEEG